MAKKRKTKRKSKDQDRAEVLAWVREYRSVITAAWSAYRAAQAGIEWGDWLTARGIDNVK